MDAWTVNVGSQEYFVEITFFGFWSVLHETFNHVAGGQPIDLHDFMGVVVVVDDLADLGSIGIVVCVEFVCYEGSHDLFDHPY